MSALPRRDIPNNTCLLFSSPEDFFSALFGPDQHDAHVAERRLHFRNAEHRRQLSILTDIIDETVEGCCQRIAAQHNYNTASIRRELHQVEFGSLSTMIDSPARVKHLRRVLDIAIEHHSRLAA